MEVLILTYLFDRIGALRRQLAHQRDDGYTTETILVVALMVVLGLAVIGIIATKVTAKANGINLNAP